ncbi:MAG: DUF4252 domain-containing protein [Bryobacteraceae bacterium]|nr:DUF4252 domain-containing protein [Bryobacteraceae bacterium]
MKYALFFLFATAAICQKLDLSSLDKLAERASESSIVDLDQDKLKMAMSFLSGTNPKEQSASDLVKGLKAVFVRTFEFKDKGAISVADLEPIRKQLRGPGWAKMIEVKEEGERTEVYFYKQGAESGMAVLTIEADEVTVVNLVGEINIGGLAALGSNFGLRSLGLAGGKRSTTPPPPATRIQKEEDEN